MILNFSLINFKETMLYVKHYFLIYSDTKCAIYWTKNEIFEMCLVSHEQKSKNIMSTANPPAMQKRSQLCPLDDGENLCKNPSSSHSQSTETPCPTAPSEIISLMSIVPSYGIETLQESGIEEGIIPRMNIKVEAGLELQRSLPFHYDSLDRLLIFLDLV